MARSFVRLAVLACAALAPPAALHAQSLPRAPDSWDTPAPPPPAEPDGLTWWAALRLALNVPQGRTDGGIASPDPTPPYAERVPMPAGSLAFGARLPWLEGRPLRAGLELGYYPLTGDGVRDIPNDPDMPEIFYEWSMTTLPILLGVSYAFPVDLPVELSAGAGGGAVWTRSRTRYGEVEMAPVSGWAPAWQLAGDAAYALGPGALTLGVRWLSARTDLGMQDVPEYGGAFNPAPGDVGGLHVLAGWRHDF